MRSQIHLLLFVFAIALNPRVCGSTTISLGGAPHFWGADLREALDERRDYLSTLGLDTPDSLYGLSDLQNRESLSRSLASARQRHPFWTAFFSGVILGNPSSSSDNSSRHYADAYFSQAIDLTAGHPGRLWLLVVEFRRFSELEWLEKALSELEKIFLTAGAQAAPLISQQLLWYAMADEAAGREESSRYFYSWALRFDRNLALAPIGAGLVGFPTSIPTLISNSREAVNILRDSWCAQLGVVRFVVTWIFGIITALVLGFFLYLAITYGSAGTHRAAHLLPPSLSLRLRTILVNVLGCSLLTLGIIPFLWALAMSTWTKVNPRDKILLAICCVCLVLAPYGTRIKDALSQPQAPDNPLSLFRSTIDGGYSPELEGRIQAWLRQSPEDYLAYVSAATVSLKQGDIAQATSYITQAEKLNPHDPVVLLTSGNVHYFSEAYKTANEKYSSCLARFPELEATYFNPCLYYFGEMRFIEGMDLMEKAAKLNPRLVSTFLRKNDQAFGGEWPRIRHFLQPDYKGMLFWTQALPHYWGSWKSADRGWGISFLGMPIRWYLVIGPLLFLGLLVSPRWTRSKDFSCRLCGRHLCRACVKNGLCPDCDCLSSDIGDASVRNQIHTRISQRRILIAKNIVPTVLDTLFPGSGTLQRSALFSPRVVLFLLTGSIYGLHIAMGAYHSFYSYSLAQKVFAPLSLFLVGYSLFFGVRGAILIAKALTDKAV